MHNYIRAPSGAFFNEMVMGQRLHNILWQAFSKNVKLKYHRGVVKLL